MSKTNKRFLNSLKGSWTVSEISIQYKAAVLNNRSIISTEDAYGLLKELWCNQTIALQESFVALFLNRANKTIGFREISRGTMNATIVDVKLLVSIALHSMCCSIIIAHNHPSGNLQPSDRDRDITKKIKDALSLIDVKLLDHFIVTQDGYYSFEEEGLL